MFLRLSRNPICIAKLEFRDFPSPGQYSLAGRGDGWGKAVCITHSEHKEERGRHKSICPLGQRRQLANTHSADYSLRLGDKIQDFENDVGQL